MERKRKSYIFLIGKLNRKGHLGHLGLCRDFIISRINLEPEQLCHYSNGLPAGQPGFDSRQGRKILFSPQRQDRLWGPRNLLSNGYQGLFPRGQSARGV
jgi:hypothetical protein